jgi:DnaK suppressor protein
VVIVSPKTTKKATTNKTSASKKPKGVAKKKVKEPGPYEYSKGFLKEMKQMLLKMREELLEDVTRAVKEESNHLRFDVGDFYDHASEDRQRELALTLSNRERDKLMLIEQALKRVEEGTYGICEVTGEKIGEERLRVLPFTMLSVEAQEEIERGG